MTQFERRQMVVYVSGPYRAATHDGIDRNIMAARDIHIEMIRLGYSSICPHLNTYQFERIAPDIPDQVYLDMDFEILRHCHAIVMIPGWDRSQGAKAELALAHELGLSVWYWPEVPAKIKEDDDA